MIETYFADIESTIKAYPQISSYLLKKKKYNNNQGYIGGTITFENGFRLDFIEVKLIGVAGKIKYRYQCMDREQMTIFRYDNAPHYKNLQTFPHHKHTVEGVVACTEPTLHDVLFEIAQIRHHSKK